MRLRRKIWKSQVRTNRSMKGFVSLAVRVDIFGSSRFRNRNRAIMN
jgi:hypothetical protein